MRNVVCNCLSLSDERIAVASALFLGPFAFRDVNHHDQGIGLLGQAECRTMPGSQRPLQGLEIVGLREVADATVALEGDGLGDLLVGLRGLHQDPVQLLEPPLLDDVQQPDVAARPAEREPGSLRHRTGDSVNPTR